MQAGGSFPLSYQWFKGTTEIDGATGNLLPLTGVTGTDSGDYRVRVSNGLGEILSDVATVNVGGQPAYTVSSHTAIVLEGQVGMHYRVEFRDAVAPPGEWFPLEDIQSLPWTPYLVFDPARSLGPQRFYRAVLSR